MENKPKCPQCGGELKQCKDTTWKCRDCDRTYSDWEVQDCDVVNHPSHYTHGQYECIDILQNILSAEEFSGFCRGNTLKYLWRAGKKDKAKEIEDLKKAQWYLAKLIAHKMAQEVING